MYASSRTVVTSSSVRTSELFSTKASDFVQAHCAGSFESTRASHRFKYDPSCGSPASGRAIELNLRRCRIFSSKPSQLTPAFILLFCDCIDLSENYLRERNG